METTANIRISLLFSFIVLCQSLPIGAATANGAPIAADTQNLLVSVDAANCRWSAQVKGTPMQLNDVHFLPGDDASGWTVVRDSDTGNSLLMGHVTALKGASRFDVRSGWKGKVPDRMQVRGYCSYKVTLPPGKSFPGEKLLIDFNYEPVGDLSRGGSPVARGDRPKGATNGHPLEHAARRSLLRDCRHLPDFGGCRSGV